MKKNQIILHHPLVFDVRVPMQKKVSKFASIAEFQQWMKKNFGLDTYPYEGIHRYGEDSSTDVSDITLDMLDKGTELYAFIQPKGFKHCIWAPVKVTHKYHNMVFFKCLLDDKETYIDCGASDYDYRREHPKFEAALPAHHFAPIEVIVPSYVDVFHWNLPDATKMTFVEE